MHEESPARGISPYENINTPLEQVVGHVVNLQGDYQQGKKMIRMGEEGGGRLPTGQEGDQDG